MTGGLVFSSEHQPGPPPLREDEREEDAMPIEMTYAAPGKVVVPDDTHTVLAITDHYYGYAKAEGQEDPTPAKLVQQAISNMVYNGGKRTWGYVVYAFGPGTIFDGVGGVFGDVMWSWDSKESMDAEIQPTKIGVAGTKTKFGKP